MQFPVVEWRIESKLKQADRMCGLGVAVYAFSVHVFPDYQRLMLCGSHLRLALVRHAVSSASHD